MCESPKDFQKHFKTHLEQKQRDSNEQDINVSEHSISKYRCGPCDKILSINEVKIHQRMHKQKKLCDTCGKVFSYRDNWKLHMQSHETEATGNWFICKICGKTFKFSHLLRQHVQWHSKERPFICEVCGKSFKHINHLSKHRKIHSDVKPLSCEYCRKGFARSDNLKAHLRTHTGQKPFKCDVCDAAFTHNVSLKTHKRSAHGIDMWKEQKSQVVEEFDNFNYKDPELYRNRILKGTSNSKE